MIAVIGGARSYAEPLKEIGEDIILSSKDFIKYAHEVSLVMFTGGEDISPTLYGGNNKKNFSDSNIQRDRFEMAMLNICKEYHMKVTGICRGFQFLNVMAGGFMYQHIRNHGGMMHSVHFPKRGQTYEMMSTHHQLVGIPEDAHIIGWAKPSRSKIYVGPDGTLVRPPEHEIEAAVFPRIKGFGVQFHPEMMTANQPGYKFYIQMIVDFAEMDMPEFVNLYALEEKKNAGERKAGSGGD